MATEIETSDRTISGLDALELAGLTRDRSRAAQVWAATWPKLLAVALFVFVWQAVVWSGWKEEYILPGPAAVVQELWDRMHVPVFWQALGTTMRRALTGFLLAVVIGSVVGVAVARIPVLRAAIGSMITALQTMPSIVWFPLAIVLFSGGEASIMFVVVIGAAPSIANGVIAGVDYVPPLLLRAGRNIGATGFNLYRFVIAPASLPAIVAGLKQGWAFSWRSLMAGELLVLGVALGSAMEIARADTDYPLIVAYMVVIFFIGVVVDAVFSKADRAVRERWGVTEKR